MKLIFVYNADSGLISGLKDMVHKIVSPETYECSLCAITYGNTGMHGQWRDFVDSLDADVEFLYRDELSDRYDINDVDLPAAFKKEEDEDPVLWLDAATFDGLSSVDGLIEKVLSPESGVRRQA